MKTNQTSKARWRIWIYGFLFIVMIFVFRLHQQSENWEPINPDHTDSFEYLARQINTSDTFYSNQWRQFWNRLPEQVQIVLNRIKPQLPARAQHLRACKRLRFHGQKAIPLILPKLGVSDEQMVETALVSILEINIPTDGTWDHLTRMMEDSTQSEALRIVAFQVWIAIHHTEQRCLDYIDQLAVSKGGWFQSLNESLTSHGTTVMNFWEKAKPEFLVRVRSKLSKSFLKSLVTRNSLPHSQLAHFFICEETGIGNNRQKNAIKYLLTANASQFPNNFTQFSSGYPGLLYSLGTEDENYFNKAARSHSPLIQELAIKFYPYSREITDEMADSLIRIISGNSVKAADDAFFIFCKSGRSPTSIQFNKILSYLDKEEPLYQHLAIRAILAWSPGEFEEKLDALLACTFPHPLEVSTYDLLRFIQMFRTSKGALQVVLERLENYHVVAKTLSEKVMRYSRASSEQDYIPISMQSELDQAYRKRSWLLRLLKENTEEYPRLMSTLDESVLDPLNPQRYEEALWKWQIAPDTEFTVTLLDQAFQSGAYPPESAIQLAVAMGDRALAILKPFLQHDNESIRIDFFWQVCTKVKNITEVTPYLDLAKKGASSMTIQRLDMMSMTLPKR